MVYTGYIPGDVRDLSVVMVGDLSVIMVGGLSVIRVGRSVNNHGSSDHLCAANVCLSHSK